MSARKRNALVAAFLGLVLVLASAAPAFALYGDVYDEGFGGGSGWRGVGGDTFAYAWSLVPGNPTYPGRHVSSLYMHNVNYNPVQGDGYNDSVTHNYIHMETGVVMTYGQYPQVFWQWNKTAGGFGDWRQQIEYIIPAQDVWVPDFKIGNVSMGSYAPETWHINDYSGTMESVDMPLVVGRAMASAERQWLDDEYPPLGDSNKASFVGLIRKNSNASWLSWRDSAPIANGDPYYSFTKNGDDDLYHGRN